MNCLSKSPHEIPDATQSLAVAQPGIPPDLKREILERGRPLRLAPNCILFREGDAPDNLFLLTKGKVIFSIHSAGRLVPCFMIESTCMIGLSAIVARAPMALTATASPGARLVQMDANAFLELIESRTEWYMSCLRALAEETVQAHRALAEMLAA